MDTSDAPSVSVHLAQIPNRRPLVAVLGIEVFLAILIVFIVVTWGNPPSRLTDSDPNVQRVIHVIGGYFILWAMAVVFRSGLALFGRLPLVTASATVDGDTELRFRAPSLRPRVLRVPRGSAVEVTARANSKATVFRSRAYFIRSLVVRVGTQRLAAIGYYAIRRGDVTALIALLEAQGCTVGFQGGSTLRD